MDGPRLARWQISSVYLVVQGVAGVGWWIGLNTSQGFQEWFVAPGGWPAARTALVADVVLFGGGSILAGALSFRAHRHAPVVVLILVGVSAYATLVAAAWVGSPVERWLGVAVMVPALAATCAVAVSMMRNAENRP